MSKINDLIKELCPNGVEYKLFYSVAKYIRGITYNKSNETEEVNSYKVLRANNITLDSNKLNFEDVKKVYKYVRVKDEQWLKKGDILICAGSGSKEHIGKVAYIAEDIDYTFGGFMGVIRCNKSINSSFMFHILTSNIFRKHIGITINSTTINNINNQTFENLSIPIPPLEVQEKIVKILDKFGELEAELEAELEVRKSQYEFWRDKIYEVEYSKGSNIKLFDCIERLSTGLNPRKNFKLNEPGADLYYITGKDVFNHKINVSNRTDLISADVVDLINKRAKLEDDILMFASTGTGTVGRMTYVEKYDRNWNVSETMFLIKTKPNLLTKYLMYFLESNVAISQYKEKISRGSVPHLKVKDLLDVSVPIIDLKKQKEIVDIIDKFESLSASIICGLPAEIELRRKQYEYYRNKLLSFEELSVSE